MRHIASVMPRVARHDIYRTVTDTIITQIEAGAGAFQMPWHHDGSAIGRPRNARSETNYRGINVIALWAAAYAAGYSSGLWATYRQWQELGAQVQKREKGTLVVFWKKHEAILTENEEPTEETRPRYIARGFTVFNAAQVHGYTPPEVPKLSDSEREYRAESFYASLKIETKFGGNEAYYVPSKDYVQMPNFERFRNALAFYATLLHEGAHATAAPHRLNRDLSARFGSEVYAMEEMIADLASCLACMTLELSPEPRKQHSGYIASWLKVLRNDKRAVFTAASKAQEIADWMWAQQPDDFPRRLR